MDAAPGPAPEDASAIAVLIQACPPETRAALVDAWHKHVLTDPESLPAQWALIHYSLAQFIRTTGERMAEADQALSAKAQDQMTGLEIAFGKAAKAQSDATAAQDKITTTNKHHTDELKGIIDTAQKTFGTLVQRHGQAFDEGVRKVEALAQLAAAAGKQVESIQYRSQATTKRTYLGAGILIGVTGTLLFHYLF